MALPSFRYGARGYYGLDSLRACMMLLGVLFHAACAYTTLPINWLYKDPSKSSAFNLPLLIIHQFRMPIFFLLAGFFANLSWQRIGTGAFFRNRVRRILLPFLISWPFLFVVTRLGYVYAASLTGTAVLPPWRTWEYYRSGQIFSTFRTMHLWFLYYLMFLYPISVGLAVAAQRYVGPIRRRWLKDILRHAINSPWRPLLFAVPSAVVLLLTNSALIQTDGSFVVDPVTLSFYGIFFQACWLIFSNSELLPTFQRRAWLQIAGGIVSSSVYFLCLRKSQSATPKMTPVFHAVSASSGALGMWLLLFGIVGLFLKYLNKPELRLRYLTNASYWIYLVHPPLMIWGAIALRLLPVSALVKFSLLLTISVPMLIASYELFVRRTAIGRVLNSSRHSEPLSSMVVRTRARVAS